MYHLPAVGYVLHDYHFAPVGATFRYLVSSQRAIFCKLYAGQRSSAIGRKYVRVQKHFRLPFAHLPVQHRLVLQAIIFKEISVFAFFKWRRKLFVIPQFGKPFFDGISKRYLCQVSPGSSHLLLHPCLCIGSRIVFRASGKDRLPVCRKIHLPVLQFLLPGKCP